MRTSANLSVFATVVNAIKLITEKNITKKLHCQVISRSNSEVTHWLYASINLAKGRTSKLINSCGQNFQFN